MLFNIFRKKEKRLFPSYTFGIVKNTRISKENGIYDEYNKIIEIYSNGKLVNRIEYSEEDVDSLIEINEIPIVEETISDELDFEDVSGFGSVNL